MKKILLTFSVAIFIMSCSNSQQDTIANMGVGNMPSDIPNPNSIAEQVRIKEQKITDSISEEIRKEQVRKEEQQRKLDSIKEAKIHSKYQKVIDKCNCDMNEEQADLVLRHRFQVGMSKKMVRMSIGSPSFTTQYSDGRTYYGYGWDWLYFDQYGNLEYWILNNVN